MTLPHLPVSQFHLSSREILEHPNHLQQKLYDQQSAKVLLTTWALQYTFQVYWWGISVTNFPWRKFLRRSQIISSVCWQNEYARNQYFSAEEK
jgi:hypothetical protein